MPSGSARTARMDTKPAAAAAAPPSNSLLEIVHMCVLLSRLRPEALAPGSPLRVPIAARGLEGAGKHHVNQFFLWAPAAATPHTRRHPSILRCWPFRIASSSASRNKSRRSRPRVRAPEGGPKATPPARLPVLRNGAGRRGKGDEPAALAARFALVEKSQSRCVEKSME